MYIKQLYTGCLSEAAYYIESEGEAAVVDPMRDIDEYLEMAATRGASIKYIFETHFHADFVSGHLDLSKATGAEIIYGPETKTGFPVHIASDGEIFRLGNISLEVLHTPGHTLESACYLLKDETGKNHCVFTGDTLFVSDVGRPDLSQKSDEYTVQDLAGMMYESLKSKIMPLADDVLVYPAHGPGSSCGKNLGPSTFSTIGQEKTSNYALRQAGKNEFINAVIDGLEAPPDYFPINARINKEGYDNIDEVLERGTKALSLEEFKKLHERGAIALDTRRGEVFLQAFIPSAINIGLEGRFAEWAGSLLPFDQPIILVTEAGKEKESVIRLARVGFDKIAGCLAGGFSTWNNAGEETDMIISIDADELAMDIPFDKNLVVLDVRRSGEFLQGHVAGAVNLPLAVMSDPASMAMINEEENLYVHCESGYRSIVAASLLKRQGLHNLRNVNGGWNEITKQKKIKTAVEKTILN